MDKRFVVPDLQPNNSSKKEYTNKEIIIDGKKMIALSIDRPKERKISSLLKAIPVEHIK